ncbi:hypothetical protein EYF80_047736 [Liparis tanakae]|uniref:C3H1-type domain-containing protein n=1 Tax=Liparis tanakae TaxID=230148 RepID=A0A4Z2FM41_9TELE|nr:hypothetical protein EYF80_047736 [Liparis tanakae]
MHISIMHSPSTFSFFHCSSSFSWILMSLCSSACLTGDNCIYDHQRQRDFKRARAPTRFAFSHTWFSFAILNSTGCPSPGSLTSREYFPAIAPTPTHRATTKHRSFILKTTLHSPEMRACAGGRTDEAEGEKWTEVMRAKTRVAEEWQRLGEVWQKLGEVWQRMGEVWQKLGEMWQRMGEVWQRMGER